MEPCPQRVRLFFQFNEKGDHLCKDDERSYLNQRDIIKLNVNHSSVLNDKIYGDNIDRLIDIFVQ